VHESEPHASALARPTLACFSMRRTHGPEDHRRKTVRLPEAKPVGKLKTLTVVLTGLKLAALTRSVRCWRGARLIMTASPMSPSAATVGAVQVGTILCDKYEIVRELGIGGMGVVWVARDRVLDVEVALKVVERAAADPDDFKQRALNEARLAARLVHPAVCRSVDFGLSEQGDPFVVSELLNGESLDRLLEREGRMPAVRAVRVLLPIIDALEAAHEAGIIHRDVKPANLFLARVGAQRIQPKLLDFGVACLLDDGDRGQVSGRICGTPAYMSPEQARGERELDGRSDVWGLCVTLYELVTGASPFDGDSYNSVLWAVQSVNPAPITDFSAGDPALAKIIARGLERERNGRWASAANLGRELARWLLSVGEETDATGYSLRARLVETLHDADEQSDITDPTAVIPSSTRAAVAPSLPTPDRSSVRLGRAAVMGGALIALIGFTHWHLSRAPTARGTIVPVSMAARAPAPPAAALTATSAQVAVPPTPDVPFAIPAQSAAAPINALPTARSSAVGSWQPPQKRPAAGQRPERVELPPSANSTPVTPPKPVASASSRPVQPHQANNALQFDFGL
jgi:serine/threonine protein kinase